MEYLGNNYGYIIVGIIFVIGILSAIHGWFSEKSENIENKKIREVLLDKEINFEEECIKRKKIIEVENNNLSIMKANILQLAKEKAVGFPFLAKAYDEYFELKDRQEEFHLRTKKHPAPVKALKLREAAASKREVLFRNRIVKYQIAYYEFLFPWLKDYKDVEIEDDYIINYTGKQTDDTIDKEEIDPASQWLTEAEYKNLSSIEKNQKALDHYWVTNKSPWEVGRLYERFIGFQYESKGYDVLYFGILEGFDDMGRDLICKKGNETIIVQCKCWQHEKTIHEKHINQLYGTCAKYLLDLDEDIHQGDLFEGFKINKRVQAHFVTSAKLSDRAKKFADALGIVYKENCVLEKFPCIKCNVSRIDGSYIYHLPFDQQYDKVKIEKYRGEFYAASVSEAEQRGFRRAWRWHSTNEQNIS
jgi:hypothetical protein